jgi:hypothetical protein
MLYHCCGEPVDVVNAHGESCMVRVVGTGEPFFCPAADLRADGGAAEVTAALAAARFREALHLAEVEVMDFEANP